MKQIELRQGGCGQLCAEILTGLPEWFGMAEANAAYETDAESQPTYVAYDGARPVGLMILKRHEGALENHLLAVRRDERGAGIGTALIAMAVAAAVEQGLSFLTVKTLGPSHPGQPYAETRAFYRSAGFTPVEEFTNIWGPDQPCLFMVKAV